jgi:hypothetical protein
VIKYFLTSLHVRNGKEKQMKTKSHHCRVENVSGHSSYTVLVNFDKVLADKRTIGNKVAKTLISSDLAVA